MDQTKACRLRIEFEGKEMCTISRAPTSVAYAAPIATDHPALVAIDSTGARRSYDMSSVLSNGGAAGAATGDDDGPRAAWAHFCFRTNPVLGAQFDCLLSDSEVFPRETYEQGRSLGIRFQPFMLPESGVPAAKFTGRGMAYRGLHFPGLITPGNLSFICICDHCRENFRVQSIHAGFSNAVYLYCDNCPNVLLVNERRADAPALLKKPDPDALRRFELGLPPCAQCGGGFAYYNPFRCPLCKAPFVDFRAHPDEREAEYYAAVVFGGVVQELGDE